jgi:hypothetical protein
MKIYLLTVILPLLIGLMYGNLLLYAVKFKFAVFGRIGLVVLFLMAHRYFSKSTEPLLLQLEVHHHIMMLITFIASMWLAVIWHLKGRKIR